ncbi:hypothetical protein ACETIH_22720, partial [Microvirga arabica]
AVRHVHTLTALKIVKADAHFRDMADPVRRSAQTKRRVHLAPHAFVAPSQSELNLAAPQVRLELMNCPQGCHIDIDINATDLFAVPARGDLRLFQQRSELRRPFNDRGLMERHAAPHSTSWPRARPDVSKKEAKLTGSKATHIE